MSDELKSPRINLRDQFALAVVRRVMPEAPVEGSYTEAKWIAEASYRIADALMWARRPSRRLTRGDKE